LALIKAISISTPQAHKHLGEKFLVKLMQKLQLLSRRERSFPHLHRIFPSRTIYPPQISHVNLQLAPEGKNVNSEKPNALFCGARRRKDLEQIIRRKICVKTLF